MGWGGFVTLHLGCLGLSVSKNGRVKGLETREYLQETRAIHISETTHGEMTRPLKSSKPMLGRSEKPRLGGLDVNGITVDHLSALCSKCASL